MEKKKAFSLTSGTRPSYSISVWFISQRKRQEKERKWIQIGKEEVRLSLVADA
jgi:hypothetical protein